MTPRSHHYSWVAVLAVLLVYGVNSAQDLRNVAEWNVGKAKLAIQGYDPVAYFPDGGSAAIIGSESFTAESGGAVYRFASAAHRETFLANPARYEPAHGGWCSYAMLGGDKVQVDPKSFIVQDGRLFLFYKGFLGDTRAKWLKADTASEAKTADAMWKKISGESARTPGAVATPHKEKPMSDRRPSRDELKKELTPEQFEVVCNAGTEPPFRNAYWDNHAPGIYVDVVSGEPLFSSLDKFDSGTGWPSFTKPLASANIAEKQDLTLGMPRTEVTSTKGGSHLGHVFDDGPQPSGRRFCINSASLRFIPADKLEAEGYGRYAASFAKRTSQEIATLAGGCFWGMEDILRKVPGVLATRVGYAGGTRQAESVEVTFDPSVISYEKLLETYFFRMHDPTTLNRQGNDTGTEYRSAIFYHSDEQRRTAEKVKERVDESGRWKRPIVTEITAAGPFDLAEDRHQDYLERNPGGYSCHFLRD